MGKITPDHSILKTPEQIEKIKESAVINVAILDRIEKEIHDTLSELDVNIAADTQRLPDLDELRQTGGLDFIDLDMPYEYDDDDPESEYYDNGNPDGEDYDAGADRGRIASPGTYT